MENHPGHRGESPGAHHRGNRKVGILRGSHDLPRPCSAAGRGISALYQEDRAEKRLGLCGYLQVHGPAAFFAHRTHVPIPVRRPRAGVQGHSVLRLAGIAVQKGAVDPFAPDDRLPGQNSIGFPRGDQTVQKLRQVPGDAHPSRQGRARTPPDRDGLQPLETKGRRAPQGRSLQGLVLPGDHVSDRPLSPCATPCGCSSSTASSC